MMQQIMSVFIVIMVMIKWIDHNLTITSTSSAKILQKIDFKEFFFLQLLSETQQNLQKI